MYDPDAITNLTNKYQQDTVRKLEIASGLLAAQRVNNHMNRVEAAAAQSVALQEQAIAEARRQNWVQNQLASGREMWDIQQELSAVDAEQAVQQQAADEAQQAENTAGASLLLWAALSFVAFFGVWTFAHSFWWAVLSVIVQGFLAYSVRTHGPATGKHVA